METELNYMRMAFWADAADSNDPLPPGLAASMANDLDAIARDIALFYLENGRSPHLEEGGACHT